MTIFLILFPLIVVTAGGLAFRQPWRRERVERLRDQARLKAIEAQMAGLRATLRISAAEQVARRRMRELHDRDLFTNSTIPEEPEQWR